MRCRICRPELAAALLMALAACGERSGSGATDTPSPQPEPPRYADALAAIDADLVRAHAAAAREPQSALAHERVARALLDRGALSGAFDDYAGAVDAVARAGAAVSCQTAVRVALAVHRLDGARAHLARCAAPAALAPADRAAIAGLEADLALQDGRYDQALRLARASLAQHETPQALARLALIHVALGAPTEALALLDRSEKIDHAVTPVLRAWLALQRGEIALHRGRWDEALAHTLAADRQLAGWWRVAEHVAEARALLGQQQAAVETYRRVLAQTEDPPVMGALALLLHEAGEVREADALIARAETVLRAHLERLPEAALDTAVAHFLLFAPRAPETLALARRSAGLRRAGETRLALARALLAAGHTAAAAQEIRVLLVAPWHTAELHAVAHHVFARAGRAEPAQAQAALADAMNPRWREQYPDK